MAFLDSLLSLLNNVARICVKEALTSEVKLLLEAERLESLLEDLFS